MGAGVDSCTVIMLTSRVTAAFLARHLPITFAFVFSVMAVKARILPMNDTPVLRVADEPTRQ